MEVLTLLLSGLIALVSPVGVIVDRTAEGAIRSQFQSVEQLQVRVDNAPSYQIVQGRADRLQVAGRGLFVTKDLRLAVLELETDPIAIDPASVGQGTPKLEQPLQAGVRVVLDEADMNRALQAPGLTAQIRNLAINLPNVPQARQIQRYDFLNPRVEFLAGDRVQFQIELQEQGFPDKLVITARSGLQITAGQRLQFIDPVLLVNGETTPDEIVTAITQGISERFDLHRWEARGVTARLLSVKTTAGQATIAAFVRVEPQALK